MCVSGRGGHITIEVAEFEHPSRAHVFSKQHLNQQMSHQQQNATMVSTHDLSRHGLIHLDMSRKQVYSQCAYVCIF